ncbi:hypothetical protein AB0F52_09680 [Amycolatopsis sp. NPDC024027]|uniref:hypothetical protein n=1 Tax=Amycolatopsis sp. NPDC024027 TaxID=3154327 RepID=UPI0033C47BD4
MSTPDNGQFLHGLEIEVEAELGIAESSHLEDAARTPVTEWLFDPTDAERYEVNLRGLLGAVEAVEEGETR